MTSPTSNSPGLSSQFQLIGLLVLVALMAFLAWAIFARDRDEIVIPDAAVAGTYADARVEQSRLTRRYNAATAYLEHAGYYGGWTSTRHLQAADLWRNLGDEQRAIAHLEAVLAAGNPDIALLQELATVYLRQGHFSRADDLLAQLITRDPSHAWSRWQRGLLLAPTDPTTALGLLRQVQFDADYGDSAQAIIAILTTPQRDALRALAIGSQLAQYGYLNLAEHAFQMAADIAHPFPLALANVGWMRDLQNKDGGAWISGALALEPENPEILTIAGIHERLNDRYDISIEYLLTAITFDPDNAAIYAELGETYRVAGSVDDAAYWFNSAVSISGDDPAFISIRDRFYEQEIALLPQEAIANAYREQLDQSDNPDLLTAYGRALHQRGQSEAGLIQVERALTLDPQHPQAIVDKARILIALNRPEEARNLLTDLLKRETALNDAAQALLDTLP